MQFVFVLVRVRARACFLCVYVCVCVGKGGGEKGDMLSYMCCPLLFMGGATFSFWNKEFLALT